MTQRFVRNVESRQFLWRRLHSLSGLLPVGVFIFFHLGTNSLIAVSSPSTDLYQKQVDNIHSLGPLLVPVEVLFILFPLAFHAAIGVRIWLESKPNTSAYAYNGNIRYTLQRVTGVVALLFILLHLWHMHWSLGSLIPGGHKFVGSAASLSTAQAIQTLPLGSLIYATGVICVCYHFANGTWTFLITWGITIGPHSQRISGYACTALGIALTITGLTAVQGFRTYDTKAAEPGVKAQPSTEAGHEAKPPLAAGHESG